MLELNLLQYTNLCCRVIKMMRLKVRVLKKITTKKRERQRERACYSTTAKVKMFQQNAQRKKRVKATSKLLYAINY